MRRRSQNTSNLKKIHEMNRTLASKITREIIGSRSQNYFAKECSYSTSAISQLVNGKLQNIEPDFAQAIWDNREQNCSVTEEEFLEAFGMIKDIAPEPVDDFREHSRRDKSSENHKDVKTIFLAISIIQKTLLGNQYPILGTIEHFLLKSNLAKTTKFDFLIKTEISRAKIEWAMEIVPTSLTKTEDFFELLFATLYVQSEKLSELRYSAITFDHRIFNLIKEVYKNVTVDDYISVILLDNKEFTVADEFVMARKTAQDNVQSIFT